MTKKKQGKPWLAPCDRPAQHWQEFRGRLLSPPAPADQRRAVRQAPPLRSISKPPGEFNADPISGERKVALQTGGDKPIITISLMGTVTAGTKTQSEVGSVAVHDSGLMPCSVVQEPVVPQPMVQEQVRDLLDDDEIQSLGDVIDRQRTEIEVLKTQLDKSKSDVLFWQSRARTLSADARSNADKQEIEHADFKSKTSNLERSLELYTQYNAELLRHVNVLLLATSSDNTRSAAPFPPASAPDPIVRKADELAISSVSAGADIVSPTIAQDAAPISELRIDTQQTAYSGPAAARADTEFIAVRQRPVDVQDMDFDGPVIAPIQKKRKVSP